MSGSRPNILFLMTDQMQGRVLEPGHPCLTPNLDRLAARGVRFTRAYTPNAVCSPARASLMTGLLPHNHGVLEVIHNVDDDQSVLRVDRPHWAQRLSEAGYRTGYFGKWHVERSNRLERFGWQAYELKQKGKKVKAKAKPDEAAAWSEFPLAKTVDDPPGYASRLHYAVTEDPPESRGVGITTDLALEFLNEVLQGDEPWCCMVSVTEPHDPFVAGREAFELYRVDELPLAPNVHDDLAGRPNIYRKVQAPWRRLTDRDRREAAACYYASITEIDAQYGRLIDAVERAGQSDRTLIVFTSDHGELLGAHGLYCKNFSAYEEVYNIPLVIAGPGVAAGVVTSARAGLHDLCPTLLELVGLEPIGAPDSKSFAGLLADPGRFEGEYQTGFAEYHGGRYRLTQRVYWDGPWKYVHNGFDFDELYNLDDDPFELRNLAQDERYDAVVRRMLAGMWRRVRETGDHSLFNSDYPILRAAPYGPLVAEAVDA